MPKKKTYEEYVAELKEVNPNVEPLENYINANTKIKHRCLIDGYEWYAAPSHFLNKHRGCPMCSNCVHWTTESFKEKLKEINPNIEIIGEYINTGTKIKCRCLIDGYEWYTLPRLLLRGYGCHRCANSERYTTETFKEKLKKVNPNIEVLSEYINTSTKIKCKCLIDGCIWYPTPNSLLSGQGCPRCGGVERYTTESFKEKLKEINPNVKILGEYKTNKTKIQCECLICGRTWENSPTHLLSGEGCPRCAHANTSWLQEELFTYFSQKYPSTLFRDTTLIGKELDIVIPELNIAIEPGGWHWHFEIENKLSDDYKKQLLCKEKGYKCITIYDKCTDPEFPWFPCIIYDVDIGKNKELFTDVINNIEDIIKEVTQCQL